MAASAVRELIVRIAYALNKSSQRKADSSINATKKNMEGMAKSAETAGAVAAKGFQETGTAARKAAADVAVAAKQMGAYQDKLGRWHAANGRFISLGGGVDVPKGGGSLGRFSKYLDAIRSKSILARSAVGSIAGAVGALTVALNPLALVFAGAFSVYAIKNAADEMMNLDGRLRTLYEDEQERLAIEDRLYAMSQRNRQGLNEIGDLYFKVASSVEQYGMGAAEASRLTDIVSKSLTVGGASAEQASATILQLGQALGSGQLQGDELSSLRENAFTLMKEMSKSLGVTVGDLKEMGAQGELTSEVVINAILASGDAIDAQFAKMPTTIGQAMTKVGNFFRRFVGDIQNSTGIFGEIAQKISETVDWFDKIRQVMNGTFDFSTVSDDEMSSLIDLKYDLLAAWDILKKIGGYLQTGFSAAVDIAGGVINWFRDNWEMLSAAAEPILGNINDGINYLEHSLTANKGVWQVWGGVILGLLWAILETASWVFKGAAAFIDIFTTAIQKVADALTTVIDKLREALGLQQQFNASGSATEAVAKQWFQPTVYQNNEYHLNDSSQLNDAVASAGYGLPAWMAGP